MKTTDLANMMPAQYHDCAVHSALCMLIGSASRLGREIGRGRHGEKKWLDTYREDLREDCERLLMLCLEGDVTPEMIDELVERAN